jgi:3-dehydroquinate synthase
MKPDHAGILRVNLRRQVDDSYEIVVGENLFPRLVRDLCQKPLGHRYVVISDSTVVKLYGRKLIRLLQEAGLRADGLIFRAGEKSKTRPVKQRLEGGLARLGVGRDGAILAVGGGVTGDLAGFVAATYYRGIPYLQVPTTLLAMVDSSIGGKTGVDTRHGKNLIGAFYQPKRVYADVLTLKTLPPREFISGLAEVVKHAVIGDRTLFRFLEQFGLRLLARDAAVTAQIVHRNLLIKAALVEADEREQNLRRVLNYGHTLGHALEALTGYRVLHGEAVSLGMVLEGKLAKALGYFPEEEYLRQNALLRRFGLPVSLGPALKTWLDRKVSADEIIAWTFSDKKAKKGKPEYVLPARIGRMKKIRGQVGLPVEAGLIKEVLNDSLQGR